MTQYLTTFTSTVTAPVSFVLMKGLLMAARKKLPMFNGTYPGELTKNAGAASVKWERINNLTATTTALTEIVGTAGPSFLMGRALVQPTVSNVTVAIAKYGNAIQPTEELDLLQVNTRAAKFLDTLGANAGESLNALMVTAYNGATNIRYCNNAVGGATAASTVAYSVGLGDIKKAVNVINNNSGVLFTGLSDGSTKIGSSPVRSSYFGICHVDVEEDVRALTGFIPVENYASHTEIYPFEFGTVGGVRWFSTQLTQLITASTGKKTASGFRGSSTILNDVYDSYVYGKEAIGTIGLGNMHASNSYEMYNPKTPPAVEVIYKGFGSAGAADPYNEVASLAWKAWFAGKVLNVGWVVRIRSLASKL